MQFGGSRSELRADIDESRRERQFDELAERR
jgi:hypothetical protein